MRAEDWFTLFDDYSQALPCQLVEKGFDVWIGNNRGNTSGGHKHLSPEKDKIAYWDFSFAEMGT